MLDDGFETVVTAGGAVSAFADLPEGKIKIVTDNKNIFRFNFVKVCKGANRSADVVIKGLRFDNDSIALLFPDSVELLVWLPFEVVNLEIKIERQKTEIVTSEVVFGAGVAKGDDEFHERIIPQSL